MFDYAYDFGFILCYSGMATCDSRPYSYNTYHIDSFIEILEIEYSEFDRIVEDFNGKNIHSIETLKWSDCIKFDNEEDCRKCVDYFNGLLVMNKLLGE